MYKITTLAQLQVLNYSDKLFNEQYPDNILYLIGNDPEKKEISYKINNKESEVQDLGGPYTIIYSPIFMTYSAILEDGGYFVI